MLPGGQFRDSGGDGKIADLIIYGRHGSSSPQNVASERYRREVPEVEELLFRIALLCQFGHHDFGLHLLPLWGVGLQFDDFIAD